MRKKLKSNLWGWIYGTVTYEIIFINFNTGGSFLRTGYTAGDAQSLAEYLNQRHLKS